MSRIHRCYVQQGVIVQHSVIHAAECYTCSRVYDEVRYMQQCVILAAVCMIKCDTCSRVYDAVRYMQQCVIHSRAAEWDTCSRVYDAV